MSMNRSEHKKVNRDISREERSRRQIKRRTKVVFFQKICIGVIAVCLFTFIGFLCVTQIPGLRAGLETSKAKKMVEQKKYEQAITYYKKALEIKSNSPKTYTSMAKVYLDLNDYENAGKILEEGLEKTQDEKIKEVYITVLLNESTKDLNEEQISWDIVEDLVLVLMKDPVNEKAYELLDAFYNRFVLADDSKNMENLFMNEANCNKYIQLLSDLLAIYKENPSEVLKQQIHQYAFLNCEQLNLPVDKIKTYADLLEQVNTVLGTEDEIEWIPALLKAEEVHNYFTPVLREFEAENFDVAKDLIVSDEYLAIRDTFIADEMEYWENTTYQVVSDIGVSFHLKDGKRSFSFMEEDPKTAENGFIKVWGFRWVDNGHLRTGISYVPVHSEREGELYREYEIMYWWATAKNVALAESTYAKMNYRFETRRYTEDGLITDVINDWGGSYEYRDSYK